MRARVATHDVVFVRPKNEMDGFSHTDYNDFLVQGAGGLPSSLLPLRDFCPTKLCSIAMKK